MTKGKPPAFFCYAKQVYSSAMDLSAAEFGLYWRAVCWEWDNGPLPANERRRARILGMNLDTEAESFRQAWEAISRLWTETPDGWISDYISERRAERDLFIKKSAAGGKASGRSRRRKSYESKRASAKSAANLNRGSDGQVSRPLSDSAKLAKRRAERRAERAKGRKSNVGSGGFEPVSGNLLNDLPISVQSEAEHSTCTSRDLAENQDLGSTEISSHTRADRARASADESREPRQAGQEPPGGTNGPPTLPPGLGGPPGASQGRHAAHAWCAPSHRPGFCVTANLHNELRGKTLYSDAGLRQLYAVTLRRFDGQPIGDDVFDFWRARCIEWVGSVNGSARGDPGGEFLARRAEREAGMYRGMDWADECREMHNLECPNRRQHEHRKAMDEQASRARP